MKIFWFLILPQKKIVPTFTEMNSPNFATTGNYQNIRTFYFAFRRLVSEKKINVGSIGKTETDFLATHIRCNPAWTAAQAHTVYHILRRFSLECKLHGLQFSELQEPKAEAEIQAPRPVAKRIESVTLSGDNFSIYVNYEASLVQEIKKKFRGYKWDTVAKSWVIPLHHAKELGEFAAKRKIMLGDSAARYIQDIGSNYEQSYKAERVELEIPLKKRLYDYQTVGVDYSVRVKRSWLTDQMGLGKTPQGIATAVAVHKFPVILVCPKSLRNNWANEIHGWTDKKAIIATDKNIGKIHRFIETGMLDFLIINYEGLEKFFCKSLTTQPGEKGFNVVLNGRERMFNGIIIDEAHELKNKDTRRFAAAFRVCEHMEFRQLLTGTPFVNHIKDLAAQLHLLGQVDHFGGYSAFVSKYSRISKDEFENKSKPTPLLVELNTRLRSLCMIRREKHQVLKELPDKFRTIVKVPLDNRADYDVAEWNLQEYLARINYDDEQIRRSLQAEVLARLQHLKRLSVAGKVKQFVEYVNNILSQGEKVIIFCWHREAIEKLRGYWPDLLEISGGVSDDQVENNKALFQENPAFQLIVITYKRGGVGHTLTAASNVCFLELGWNPKDQDQAEDRAHRIGQKSNVNCHYFLGEKTVDEDIYELIDRKRRVGSQSVGATEQIATSVQSDIINKFKTKPKLPNGKQPKPELEPAG